jgi:hypothetical protein
MLFSSVARWLKPSRHPGRSRPSRRRRVKPQLEALEDRCVPSTDMVTNLSGSAAVPGSLPYWVANAAKGDTIQFAPGLNGIITLANTQDITQDLTIDGAGVGITVNGGGNQVFRIEPNVTATINALTITGGVGPSISNGGGIYNNGSLSLSNSTVTGNSAFIGGGIFNTSIGTLTMSGDTVNNNTATQFGGGVGNSGTLTITNSTIAANAANRGGGIANNGVLKMGNSTVASNTVTGAGGDGGGIFTFGASSQLDLLYTIVSNPNSGASTKNDVLGTIDQAQGNLFGSGASIVSGGDLGGNQFNVNPQLGPLQNNGGPTATMALLPGSPAIGAAAGISLIVGLSVPGVDQRGAPRPANSIDLGAFQTQPQAPASQAPAITSANNTAFTVGAAGTFTVTTTGLPAPSLMESGSLPGSVKFTDNGNGTATLAGTPTVAGQFPITITASNGVLPDAKQTFTLTVLPVTTSGAPSLTSAGSTTFVQGTAGTFTVTTTGNPTASLSESGSLPNGVQFTDLGNGTATLAGIPTAAGQFPVTITATNGVLPNATQAFTLTVLTPQQRFVQALYQDDLGRAADLSNPNGAGYWVNLLTSATLDQAAVAAGVVHSHEAQTRVVTGWYQAYLGRQPVNGEEQYWVLQLAQGQTEEQVLGGILGSDEFFARAQTLVGAGTPPERYVQALYQQLLNRPGSAAEVAYWVNQLSQLGRPGVAQGFLASTEYRTDVVTGDYNTLLHSTASAAEVNYWVFSALDVASIRVGFEASPEFFTNG